MWINYWTVVEYLNASRRWLLGLVAPLFLGNLLLNDSFALYIYIYICSWGILSFLQHDLLWLYIYKVQTTAYEVFCIETNAASCLNLWLWIILQQNKFNFMSQSLMRYLSLVPNCIYSFQLHNYLFRSLRLARYLKVIEVHCSHILHWLGDN